MTFDGERRFPRPVGGCSLQGSRRGRIVGKRIDREEAGGLPYSAGLSPVCQIWQLHWMTN